MKIPVFVGAFMPDISYLWVTWSIMTFCNYKCRYCAVRSGNRDDIASDKVIDDTIGFIYNAHQDVKEVTLFGGEPTLHPRLEYIVENLSPVCEKLHVFTNLSLGKEKMKFLTNRNVAFSVSYHPDIIPASSFLKNLEILLSFGADIDFVNVMMVDDKQDDMDAVCDFLRVNRIRHRLLPIWGDGSQINWLKSISYSRNEDVIPIRNTIVRFDDDKEMVLSEQECIYLGFNNFRYYRCYAGSKSLYIDHNGLTYRCQADMRNGIVMCKTDEKLPEQEFYVCPHEKCTCEYYIPKLIYKEKN